MKYSVALAALVGGAAPTAMAYDGLVKPMQTFFIPLPEESIFDNMFHEINGAVANPPVTSFVNFAISTDNTIIWYDHWEGGYEEDVTKPTMDMTEIWGDGKASNGCSPLVVDCTDANDKPLMAGDVIVLQNVINIPRNPDNYEGIHYDGGDMIKASFPIAMTRGAYPKDPGSLMAGAVEVLDVDNWGFKYVAPVGQDVYVPPDKKNPDGKNGAFQYSAMFFMAAEDNTVVTMPNGSKHTLNKGEGYHARVNTGDTIEADKKIQVDFIIGQVDSRYELRWYSLMPQESWSNDYTSPVGDSIGKTKALLYNPHDHDITVKMYYLDGGNVVPKETVVPSKNYKMSSVIPTGSGAKLVSVNEETFLALSMTDTGDQTGSSSSFSKHSSYGQWYDWGFPIVPTRLLTSQVLIGWGYGCTDRNCKGQVDRSVVWISAVADADVYIDFGNTGDDYVVRSVKRLQGIQVKDPTDQDMSGAIIFATEPGSGIDGPPVDIAAAWGQDPEVSRADQPLSMDLGTVVLPFTGVRVSKEVNKQQVGPGEILTYTIRVVNVGQADIKKGTYSIVDPSLPAQFYIEQSTKYTIAGDLAGTPVADDIAGATRFPLDEAGLPLQFDLLRRGGTHVITFDVVVDGASINSPTIVNTGYLVKESNGVQKPFEASTNVKLTPSISIENTVCLGHDNGACCPRAAEMQTGTPYTDVTYCYKVTNTGNTYLKNPLITNPDFDTRHEKNDYIMAPGEQYSIYYDVGQDSDKTPVMIMEDLKNTATVTADPVYASGNKIPDTNSVSHSDPSEVKKIDYEPAISIDNTVFAGNGTCSTNGVELASGLLETPVTYCFKVTNTGNTHLQKVKVVNEDLPGDVKYEREQPGLVAPGESFTFAVDEYTIDGNYTNLAMVHGEPTLPDGTPLTMYKNVFDEDDSAIEGRKPPVIQQRSGNKTVFTPPPVADTPTECMTPHWRDAGNSQPLVCKKEDITIKSLTSDRASCKEGETITITAKAELLFQKQLYDPAWFVATDGGDAKLGTCVLKGLIGGSAITVSDPAGTDLDVGAVTWNDDADNDKCGDVMIPNGNAVVACPFLVEAEMKCVDSNDDGNLDFEVCFSWREQNSDGMCTLTNDDIDTVGALADVYPAHNMKCNCVRAELPTVSVERKSSDDPVTICV